MKFLKEKYINELIDLFKDEFEITKVVEYKPSFLLPDGNFIYCKDYGHQEFDDYLYYNNEISDIDYKKLADGIFTLSKENCVRLNPGVIGRALVGLPNYNLTNTQYNSLLNWLDMVRTKHKSISIFEQLKNYPETAEYYFDNYTSDEIVKKIKRYYSSGKLYENCELLNNSNITKKHLVEDKYIDLNATYDEIDSWIKTSYNLTKKPIEGWSPAGLITKDGYYVNIPKGQLHIDILHLLMKDGLISQENEGPMEINRYNLHNTDLFTNMGYIRVNNDLWNYRYIQLPKNRLTNAQYETLTTWLDLLTQNESARRAGLDVSIDGGPAKWYSYIEDTDSVIKNIKRYYTTGKLNESKKNNSME